MIYVNKKFETNFGYQLEELIGKTLIELFYNDKNSFNLELLQEAFQNKNEIQVALKNYRKDGTELWNDFHFSPIISDTGQVNNFIGIQVDTTERKKTEIKLLEATSRISTLIHSLQSGILVEDENRAIVVANEELCGLLDISFNPIDLIGTNSALILEQSKHLLKEPEYFEERINFIISEKQKVKSEEIELKDGRVYERDYIPIFIADNYNGHLWLYDDISLRKKNEQQMRTLIKNYENSNKALTQFAYIASHDLREPLRKIASFGTLLRRSLEEKISDDEKENLDFMINGARRMQMMISDLLSYSRVSYGKIVKQAIDLNDVVNKLIEFELASAIEEAQAKIIIENDLGIIEGEKTQIRQLFQNLISNAIKYRKEILQAEIIIRSEQIGDKVKIEIQDNGIGINEKYFQQIFVMFKRLHSREQYSGTGIGLSLCSKIVENHGGEIGVESKPGIGSTFWFTIDNDSESIGL